MDATMENKMGIPSVPPPYNEIHGTAPPPSYFGANPPPPPPGLVIPQPPPPRTSVITYGTSPRVKIGAAPTGMICPSCNKQVVTRVDYVASNRTHIVSAALCILAGCCCGCLIPYCMTSCKTAYHYCPSCNAFVGTHTPY